MALTKCKSCGGQVATTAKACPHCGAVVKKAHSKGQWIFLGLVTVGIVSCIANGQSNSDKRAAEVAAVEAQKTPEQRAAEAAAKVKKEADFQRVLQGARMLKAAAKDPASFNLESALMMADGTICYEYRAKNSFNAVVPGTHVLGAKVNSNEASAWNKYCGGKTGTVFSSVRSVI